MRSEPALQDDARCPVSAACADMGSHTVRLVAAEYTAEAVCSTLAAGCPVGLGRAAMEVPW